MRRREPCPQCAGRGAAFATGTRHRWRCRPEVEARRPLRDRPRPRPCTPPPPADGAGPALAIGTALGAVAAVATMRSPHLHDPSDPFVEVVPDPGARWATHTDRDVKRIDLESGTLHIRIDRRGGDRGRGREPSRRRDRRHRNDVLGHRGVRTHPSSRGRSGTHLASATRGIEAKLTAGETWSHNQSRRHPARSRPSPTGRHPARKSWQYPLPRRRGRPTRRDQPRHERTQTPPPLRGPPTTRTSLTSGFLKLLRAGETADARAAAREYMRDFPNGFRAPEVRRLLAAPPSQTSPPSADAGQRQGS